MGRALSLAATPVPGCGSDESVDKLKFEGEADFNFKDLILEV